MIDSMNGASNGNVTTIPNDSCTAMQQQHQHQLQPQPQNPEWDCLLIACQKGDAPATRRILREHPSSKSHANPMGQTALHIAAWWGHARCVEALLKGGADANATNSFTGATPLHECLQSSAVRRSGGQRKRRMRCFSLLLEANAETQSLDASGRIPLGCLLRADADDDSDHAAIENLVTVHERATNNPLRSLLARLGSRDEGKTDAATMDEIDRLWFETGVPGMESRLKCDLLSTEIVSATEAWIDRAENTNEDETRAQGSITAQSDVRDHRCFESLSWMWDKVLEVSSESAAEHDSGDKPITHTVRSIWQDALKTLVMALFNRYERLYRRKISAPNGSFLLLDDPTLSSWNNLIIHLLKERNGSTDADGSCWRKRWTDCDDGIQQTWMAIARRGYIELARAWWDRFGISPIGVVNRQGMTALQFAARSGHFHMVQWLLQTDHSSSLFHKDDEIMAVSDWVHHRDQRGHTALAAAKANKHESIVALLEDKAASMPI